MHGEALMKEFPAIVKEVRGFGCMMGIDLSIPGQPIVDELLQRGMLVNCTHDTVLRLLPPMIMEDEQIDLLFGELRTLFGGLKK
jgi:acetylornithine/N-succinyldiaminopimelate aminotransferase